MVIDLVQGPCGVSPAFDRLTSCLFSLGHSGFVYFHPTPIRLSCLPLHAYASTYQIPWCHSLIAVVIPTARFFPFVLPPVSPFSSVSS